MKSPFKTIYGLAALLVLPVSAAVGRAGSPAAPTFEEMATAKVNDVQASVNVEKADQEELKKIGRDFGMAYKLKSIVMRFKKPSKLRMEGKIGSSPALYIVNGQTRFYSLPQIGIKKKDDLGASPGRRYSLLELGLISSQEASDAKAKYLREESMGDKPAHVFEVGYRGDDTMKYVLWVDPSSHVILKRDWLDGAGKLKATFNYREVKEVSSGVWVPTRIEIVNSEGNVAGITTYSEVKVNQGIPDSLFEIN